MTGKAWAAVLAIIIIIGVGAYFVYTNGKTEPVVLDPSAYSWQFSDKSEGAEVPRTEVKLIAGAGTYNHTVGVYDGTCAEQETDLLAGEKSKVVCWWAGGGKEIGLFEEAGQLVVKVGDVDEGSEETEGFRGNFQVIHTIR